MRPAGVLAAIVLTCVLLCLGCGARPGAKLRRAGDEIVAAGRMFHAGTPTVLWFEPPGYDAYRVARRFPTTPNATQPQKPWPSDTPERYGDRIDVLPPDAAERVRRDGWTLDDLRRVVDLVVVHYDASGTSRRAFQTLHDRRGLSAHFLLDVDGTVYQTLDLKERAWHAGPANSRSIGIEIANVGAHPPSDAAELDRWYTRDADGEKLVLPEGEAAWLRNPDASLRPARPGPIHGEIHGRPLVQHDLTPEQYEALAKLLAALSEVFPQIELDAPRDADGNVVTRQLDEAELAAFRGVVGHHHLTGRKVDPGPAFDWDRALGRD